MVKIYLIVIMAVLFIGLISAVTIYSGESYEITLDQEYDYWSVVGNSTEVDLEVTQNGNIVTITPNNHMKGDSFEIIFFDKDKEVITVYQSSGGGGGGGSTIVYKDKNVTEYVDKEVVKEVVKEVPGETVEKIVNKIPWWIWVIVSILLIIVIIIVIREVRN